MPVLYFPENGSYEATSDSTFQIRRLEGEVENRSALPADPALAFIDFLIEDYADEWVTKMMFHYRWAIPENVANANKIMPRWNLAVPEPLAEQFPDVFGQRQIDRLAVVGSNPTTGPLIEASYRRLLGVLESHFQLHKFVLGGRPGLSDFGLFGQLSQLVQVEPSSQALARAEAPRVVAWCDALEDLSGEEPQDGDWLRCGDLPATVRALLSEIGRTYAPFLLANAAALEHGADQVECTLDGAIYTQTPFKYQGKCLSWLRGAHDALPSEARAAVDKALAGSGCDTLFAT
jgi:glutathione S-transferase